MCFELLPYNWLRCSAWRETIGHAYKRKNFGFIYSAP